MPGHLACPPAGHVIPLCSSVHLQGLSLTGSRLKIIEKKGRSQDGDNWNERKIVNIPQRAVGGGGGGVIQRLFHRPSL